MPTDFNKLHCEANSPLIIFFQPRHASGLCLGGTLSAGHRLGGSLQSTRRHRDPGVSADIGALIRAYAGLTGEYRQDVAQSGDWIRKVIEQLQVAPPVPARESLWDILDSLAGTIEAPADWAIEHDHYLYGTPKRRQSANE